MERNAASSPQSRKPNAAPLTNSKSPSTCSPRLFHKFCPAEQAWNTPASVSKLAKWAVIITTFLTGPRRFGFVIADIFRQRHCRCAAHGQSPSESAEPYAQSRGRSPIIFLRSVNQLFCEIHSDGAFATLFFGEYNDAERLLLYANCGHLPALVLRVDGSVIRLDATATVLGFSENGSAKSAMSACTPATCSPFIPMASPSPSTTDGDEFGESRLVDSLLRHRALSPPAALANIVDEVLHFSPQSNTMTSP